MLASSGIGCARNQVWQSRRTDRGLQGLILPSAAPGFPAWHPQWLRGTKLGAKEQRLLWTSCAAALNPHWVGHKPEITSLFPKAWEHFGKIFKSSAFNRLFSSTEKKEQALSWQTFLYKMGMLMNELFTGSPMEFQMFFTLVKAGKSAKQ